MNLPQAISSYNRARKWDLFMREVQPDHTTTVLDAGFTEKEYQPADNYLEKHFPHQKNITALGIDTAEEFKKRYPEVDVVTYEGRDFPFEDKQFDVCWSNAVIEHVGPWEQQLHFLKECSRVARRGFITTPNRLFPIEVHTRTPLLHFLPRDLFHAYLRRVGKDWATGNYMNLLSRADLKRMMAEAGISRYRIQANWLVVAPVDFVVLFESP